MPMQWHRPLVLLVAFFLGAFLVGMFPQINVIGWAKTKAGV